MTAVPWHRARVLAHAAPDRPAPAADPAAAVPLAAALGRVLAAPLVAVSPFPAFDNAAMDGYAVAGPGPWRVARRVLAGDGEAGTLRDGEAVEIATGAPVPAGTLAVLPYEHACRDGDVVTGDVEPGRYVRRVGEEVPAGAELAPAGTPVGPVLLGLAASVGVDDLPVRSRPRVAVLITGDEIVTSGAPGPGRVRDAVGPMLPGLVRHLGGDVVHAAPVPDTPPHLLAAELSGGGSAAVAGCDVVVVCGSSSVGPADGLRAVLVDACAELVVDGVACRPGRPQALARLPDGRWVVGVPGNPFAALVAVLTLLGPLLAGLVGRPLPALPSVPLRGDPRPRPGLTRLVPVRWAAEAALTLDAESGGSARLPATADALAAVPPGWAGEPVPLLALPF
jgi:molybdopterin molybdotransferase